MVALREEVLAKIVYWGRPEYTPRVWSVIDPAIASALRWEGRDDRAAIVADAADSAYREIASTPDGQKALETLVMGRYTHPVFTRDGDLVRIDLGVIGGSPTYFRGDVWVHSELEVFGNGITSAEVLRNLAIALVTHPGARVYQVEVDVPFRWPRPLPPGWSKGGYTYVYQVAENRLRIYRNDEPTEFRISRRLDDLRTPDPLDWTELERRPMDRMPERSFDLRSRPR
ncbi:MAG: hypothetical protein K8W52_38420 [Deltaproteobacteria bacterium]|nr:hypothetical protein [Deltaproteobacteria bacterium]